MRGVIRRHLLLSLTLALMLATTAGSAITIEPAPDANAAMTAVLGDPAGWKFSNPAYAAKMLNGKDLALATSKTVLLESTAGYPAPMDYSYTFNLQPVAKSYTSVSCTVAYAELPDKTKQGVTFNVSAISGEAAIRYSRTLAGLGDSKVKSGILSLSAVGERSLAWPEAMRKTIETQIAQTPNMADLYCTVRILVRKGQAMIWLNGRLVDNVTLRSDVMPAGAFRLNMSANVHLISVRTQAPEAVDPRFEPLSIAGNLNAAGTPDGKKITGLQAPGSTLPSTFGQKVVLDGIPFCLPERNLRGDDHIDLGSSWMRFGSLSGYFMANRGLFGGRWSGLDRLDPARIAMYVPSGQYKALHLIAAADGEANSVPIVSAQFFRPLAGHPMNFSGTAPRYTTKIEKVDGVTVTVEQGKSGLLYHVVIPLDPDKLTWFSDLPLVGLELTKEVKPYRAYPDPLEYSWHAAGLPSGVHIYAATLERAKIEAEIQPKKFGHVWTAPDQPVYTVTLRNRSGKPLVARLALTATVNDEPDGDALIKAVNLPGSDEPVSVDFPLELARYGLHQVRLTVSAGDEHSTYARNLAYLAPDTREKGDWAEGKGPIFGYWAWRGGHDTPGSAEELKIMAAAGAEGSTHAFIKGKASDDDYTLAEQLKMHTSAAFEHRSIYSTLFFDKVMAAKYNPDDPEGTAKVLIEDLKKYIVPPSATATPQYIAFFPEPQIGPITAAIPPTWYGEPDYQFTEKDTESFQKQLTMFLIGAKAVRKEWPQAKILLPYGDPMNTVVYLQKSPETRSLIDGVALDIPCFERLPEAQIHQCVVNRLHITLSEIRKYVKNPYLVMVEGPAVSSKDINTGEAEQADLAIRNFLVLMSYGIMNHESSNAPFDCANYWGENHYGGGWMNRLPLAMPKPAYVAYAAMTRHLNRANFSRGIPTGSTSVHCLQFKHYRTGKLIHVFWTIRGKRPVTVKVNPGAKLLLYDQNDNSTELKEKDGMATFTIDQSPCYLEGLTADAQVTLGEPDHADAAPAKLAKKLTNLGDGSWKLAAKEDTDYANNHPLQIARFLGNMTAARASAPLEMGDKALAVHLGKQAKERDVMPYYTTLEPKKSIAIPGKGSQLGLWVKAAGDWGRVVYCLRDARGERWISIGAREDWNNDDIHGWSYFNFDGWRYLRFQLPANAPYDNYREIGSTWWGSYGGDNVVDLPLKLEKIIVERRNKLIYNTELVPAKPDDVLLGDLYVEYEKPDDQRDEVVKLSRLRMPTPAGEPVLADTIGDLLKAGLGEPTAILKVTDPLHQYDGTRCHVHFTPVEGAQSYDIWVSPYADGRGALQLGKAWKESGGLIQNLRPNTTFYAFVTYTDKDGKPSKPSKPFTFALKDSFGYK